jgi:N,N'-diacetyllegionaminate synthase
MSQEGKSKTLIIAEAGVNHNGDIDLARKLVDVAAEAGADRVKFQTFTADKLVAIHAKKAEYQNQTTGAGESQHAMIRKMELTRDMHEVLIEHCKSREIQFFSTGFDRSSVDLLVELGQDSFKIPSGEITNLPYLRHIGQYGKPVILSTGMATLNEIEATLDVLVQAGTPREHITVLHCNTEYPTPMTLDRNLPGPDHKASLEPDELKTMVNSIRNIEKAMGDGVKRSSPSEEKNKSIARKSLVAACAILKGEVFSETNLAVKRPGAGLSPMRWDEILGCKAPRGFEVDELIEL